MNVDIPNTFIQTNNTKTVEYLRDIMKIRRKLAHIIVNIAQEMYGLYITNDIPGIIKIIIHNVNGIITILKKVGKGYVSHWFRSKSL